MARDVLINAGVAKLNADFDPDVPFSEEIVITRPERICSYDETKMELDCTRGGSGLLAGATPLSDVGCWMV